MFAPPVPSSFRARPHRLTRALGALILLPLLLCLSACGGHEEVSEEDRQAVTQLLQNYLPVLAQGYASGDLEPLKQYAAEREVARAFSRVTELADSNRYVEPTFHELTVEDIVVWGSANAYVTSVEVWDLKVYAYGSAQLLGQELGQTSRVKYQLKKRAGQWEILYRELAQVLQEGEESGAAIDDADSASSEDMTASGASDTRDTNEDEVGGSSTPETSAGPSTEETP